MLVISAEHDQSFSTETGGNAATLCRGSMWGAPKPLPHRAKGLPGLWGTFSPSTQSPEPGCLRRPPTPSPQALCPAATPRSTPSLPTLADGNLGLQWPTAEPSLCPRPSECRRTQGKLSVAQGYAHTEPERAPCVTQHGHVQPLTGAGTKQCGHGPAFTPYLWDPDR